jgi:hypothetical protein
MGPDNHRRRASADNPRTKEEAAMEAAAGNDDLPMAKNTVRDKNVLVVKMLAIAEVMTVDTMATRA